MDFVSYPLIEEFREEQFHLENRILFVFGEARRMILEGNTDGDRMWERAVLVAERHGVTVPRRPE